MEIQITEKLVREVGSIADESGFQIYIVGGFVRDYFLNRNRTDFDFTVIGDALAFANVVADRFNTKAVVYPKFRTALVPIGHSKLEFVGTRKEDYLPNSRKPIVSEGSLFDDLKRRDFTINSMAASINKEGFGELIDLFNGIEDLNSGILKTPLDPALTFNDDPLRMMRAARFASQLNFSIEKDCFDSMTAMCSRIKIVSQERISDEFFKILASDNPSKGLFILYKTGLMKYVFHEMDKLAGVEIVSEGSKEYAHKDVLRHTLKVLDNISTMTENVWLRFAALTHDIAKPATKRFSEGNGWTFHGHEELGARWMSKIFQRMRLPMDKLDYVQRLIRLHQRPMALVDDDVTDSAIRRLAVAAGDALEDLFTLCKADITTKNPNLTVKYLDNYDRVAKKVLDVQDRDKLREFQSPVRGEEIMEICRLEPSPAVGYIKKCIEEAILDGIIPNEYELAYNYFIENKDVWMKDALNYKKRQVNH